MIYTLLYDNPEQDLISRLLSIRQVDDHAEQFLHPSFSTYRHNPSLLHDMDKAVKRIIKAMKKKEKIMIFGDYDVDGITSSYILYRFFIKYLKYDNISIQYPDRSKDGYGMKNYHLDDIKTKEVNLIITVDNGITAIKEATYAKELGIDMIVTDHHHPLETLPDAYAVVNPLLGDYPFKYLAGVGVAFKLICALLEQSTFSKEQKQAAFNYFLPLVAIGTVADVVPLVSENRLIVKKGLELINRKREHLPTSLKGFLDYLNLTNTIDTYHIGFVIGPRINAGGRIQSPYDSLKALLYTGEKQLEHLEKIEEINTERRKLQEQALKIAEGMINHDQHILICASSEFHEGIVGIVAGRITERYNKPSLVLKIDEEKGTAVGSLRGPEYFDIITMISQAHELLERYGGHKCAGGITVKLEHLDRMISHFELYCKESIQPHQLPKTLTIDTPLYSHEWTPHSLKQLDLLAPFGEGNEEPTFLFRDIEITSSAAIGNGTRRHLKFFAKHGEQTLEILFWGKGEDAPLFAKGDRKDILGKVKKDSYQGNRYVEGIDFGT